MPPPIQFRDVPTEAVQPDSSDLRHFTPDQVARIWAARMQMQQEAYAAYQSRHEQQLQQEQSKFSEAELTCSAFIQTSPSPPLSTTGLQPSDSNVTPHISPRVSSCVYGQSLVSTSSPHAPHSSSRHSFSEEVRAEAQSLGCAAVVNNIYVPPSRPLSSTVSRQVSAVIQRPVIVPRVMLDLPAPSFQPHVTQLDSPSSVHSNPTASLDVVADSSTDPASQSAVFAPSVHLPAPYTLPEPDEPKPPDIAHSGFDDDAMVMSVDTPVASDDPEVLGPEQRSFDEDGDLDVPRHLLGFFNRVVD